MTIRTLLEGLSYQVQTGNDETEITEVVYDSRKITPGCMFVCIAGTTRDAHEFIPDVLEKGAVSLIIDEQHISSVKIMVDASGKSDICVISTANTRKALAFAAAAQFDHPASKLNMIGITGTKGKTTTSYMVQSILEHAGKKVGVIGTIGAIINGQKYKTANTTPESFELQRLLSLMAEAGCEYCVMEVSSQGLKLDRVAGFTFDIGVFTNFSADHIGPGEHATMEEYLYCKSLLFSQCRLGLVNIDDPSCEGAIKDHTCTIRTFGFDETADLRAEQFELTKNGGELGIRFHTSGLLNCDAAVPVPGKFSVYNALCALIIGTSVGIDTDTMLQALSRIHVKGRVEIVPVAGPYTIMIDYAHNEVSVESLLSTVKAYQPRSIICVYGGGGNRAKMRRYAMGELCGRMADLSILTADNPRDEEISSINADIKVGLAKSGGKYIEIEDRKTAIWHAMDIAQEGDLIILLGKGHEDYQEIHGVKYHYSERESIESYPGKNNTKRSHSTLS